nr:MAG TPA_asm: hypothetical protein [Caudoviricetes sp.]
MAVKTRNPLRSYLCQVGYALDFQIDKGDRL